ncbi:MULTISPECIES: carbohydrate kinase family protein [Haloferax]|uniref:Carbohydrate kinase family protein n=1 Tax=Haloferax marinum TaxID=2666143 RepID=A0A6A8G9K1_9EURY|nr:MULTISPECIES: carbohydrate kinase family protein [Haloferax]KAB1198171.1 carbohydrate kinase family protein [Haloferax sp. CBA1150]MRW97252.1 carbohydrate kinase family protein [Haloferax marinum]
MSSLDVVTVGSAVIDHIYSLSNLPKPDGGAFAREHTTDVGGVAANVASGLAEFGNKTGVISRIGRDVAAEIETDLQARDIDCTRIQIGSEESSYTLILRGPDGERMIVAGGQSVPNLRLDERDIEYASDASVVFTSAYAPDEAVLRLVTARERGEISTLVFDLAGPLSELEGRGTAPETIDRLLSVVDLFVVGEVAARSYFGGGPDEVIATLTQRGVSRAALTQGSDGALLLEGDTVHEIPAFDVDVNDTTGAGDTFTAGLIHTWLLGDYSTRDAGRFAAATAALNCTAMGARGYLPSKSDVREFVETH